MSSNRLGRTVKYILVRKEAQKVEGHLEIWGAHQHARRHQPWTTEPNERYESLEHYEPSIQRYDPSEHHESFKPTRQHGHDRRP